MEISTSSSSPSVDGPRDSFFLSYLLTLRIIPFHLMLSWGACASKSFVLWVYTAHYYSKAYRMMMNSLSISFMIGLFVENSICIAFRQITSRHNVLWLRRTLFVYFVYMFRSSYSVDLDCRINTIVIDIWNDVCLSWFYLKFINLYQSRLHPIALATTICVYLRECRVIIALALVPCILIYHI